MNKTKYDLFTLAETPPANVLEAFEAVGGHVHFVRLAKHAGIKLSSALIINWERRNLIPYTWTDGITTLAQKYVDTFPNMKYLVNFFGEPRQAPVRRIVGEYPNQKLYDAVVMSSNRRSIKGFRDFLKSRHGFTIHLSHVYWCLDLGFIPAGRIREHLRVLSHWSEAELGAIPVGFSMNARESTAWDKLNSVGGAFGWVKRIDDKKVDPHSSLIGAELTGNKLKEEMARESERRSYNNEKATRSKVKTMQDAIKSVDLKQAPQKNTSNEIEETNSLSMDDLL